MAHPNPNKMEIDENAVNGDDIQVESAGVGGSADGTSVLPGSENGSGSDGPSLQPPAAEKVKVFKVFKLAQGYVNRAIFPDKKSPDAVVAANPGGEAATLPQSLPVSPQDEAAAPVSAPGDSPEAPAAVEAKKKSYGPAFWFHNRYFGNAILLYGNQALDLVDELPNAYKALANSDLSYRFVVAKSKDAYVTLEISQWKNVNRLQLKPHFKSNRPPKHPSSLSEGQVDENAWIPAHRSSVNFDPVKDKPEALLEFLLTEGQK